MRALRLIVAVTVLVGCHNADPQSDPRVAVSPSPGHASTASSVVAPRGDAGLVFIPQTEAADCGPAAIAITLSYYGRPTTLDASKAATHFHSEPTSALDLVNAATAKGLGAIGVAAEAESVLPNLRTGDILHFDFNHFVVFDALAAEGIRLMDPAVGRRVIDRAAFAEHFTGVALLFERSPAALEARTRSIGIAPAR
jgi:ABC-type bacteriocin/lantibiotic exporter with double-glycine peptidase domain